MDMRDKFVVSNILTYVIAGENELQYSYFF